MKNILTDLNVAHPNTENELIPEMHEFMTFSEHSTVGVHLWTAWCF
jgi:hypothetical protein